MHNPRCVKSREALELLRENYGEPEIIEYLKNPPSQKELKEIIKKLGIKPFDLVRKGEPLYKDSFINKKYTDNEWIKIMLANPVLIERPIIISGNKVVIGRPPEKILEIL
jgi:arsenate reductase